MLKVTGLILIFLCFSMSSTLAAQSGADLDRKVHAVKTRIHDLRNEAEALEKKGWETKAAETWKKAKIMERELQVWLERVERDRIAKQRKKESGRGDAKSDIVAGLLAGARALRQLGRIDQAEQLERLAKEHGRKHSKQAEEKDKRALVKRYLGYLRFAVVALVETDQHKSAARIEHVMHAVEVSLEGRKDKDADRIRKQVPKAELVLDDLERAVVVLKKQGKKDKAEAVLEVLRRMAKNEKVRRRSEKEEDEEDKLFYRCDTLILFYRRTFKITVRNGLCRY